MKSLFTSWLKASPCQKSHEGFTLVELLVVLMIIGVLSGVALPSFLRIINLAYEAEAQTKLGSLTNLQNQHSSEGDKFTSSIQALDSTFKIETENYSYFIFADNKNLNGAIHVAQSKNGVSKSYIKVVYKKDQQLKNCKFKAVDLSFPPLIIFDAISNPDKYCPN